MEPQLTCYKHAFNHIQAATGPVPVEPQLTCYQRAFNHFQAATGPVPVEPQLTCYQMHAPIVDGRVDRYPIHRRVTATAIRARHGDQSLCGRLRVDVASKYRRFDGDGNARPL